MSAANQPKRVVVLRATAKDKGDGDFSVQPVRRFMLCTTGELPRVIESFESYDVAMCYAKFDGYELVSRPEQDELWPESGGLVHEFEEVLAVFGELIIIQIVVYGPNGALATRFQPRYPFWILRIGNKTPLSAHATAASAWGAVIRAENRQREELNDLKAKVQAPQATRAGPAP